MASSIRLGISLARYVDGNEYFVLASGIVIVLVLVVVFGF